MLDIIKDTIEDGLKLLPFLFITFLLMEYFEHKMSSKNKKLIGKAGKLGPLLGSILGALPQCGFSVAATNLYATRIISVGTLISIYLSTSDEMLPVLLSQKADINLIIGILITKIVVGMIIGFIIDLLIRKKEQVEVKDFCEHEHCGCSHGIGISAIKHTLSIFIFILVLSFFLNLGVSYLGEKALSRIFLKNSMFGPFITSLLGLIPNCGASILITQLYLNKAISYGSMIAGLLTGSGVALLVLFKVNKNQKENFKIISIIYGVGVLIGIILQIINYIL